MNDDWLDDDYVTIRSFGLANGELTVTFTDGSVGRVLNASVVYARHERILTELLVYGHLATSERPLVAVSITVTESVAQASITRG